MKHSRPTRNTKESSIDDELRELKGRIKEMEFLNKKKPWYKDGSLWVSLVAVSFSMFAGLHEIYRQTAEETKSKREEVLQNIINLIATDKEFKADAAKDSVDPLDYYDDALQTKFKVLLSRVDVLNAEIPNQLSYEEYRYIADMYRLYGNDLDKCESYWKKALAHAPTWTDSMYTYIHLAILYFAGGVDVRRVEEGKVLLRKALGVIRDNPWDVRHNIQDDFAVKDTTNIFGWLAEEYFSVSDTLSMLMYLDSAQHYLNKLPLNSNWRAEAVRDYKDHFHKIYSDYLMMADTLNH